jgi:hypothetical protein
MGCLLELYGICMRFSGEDLVVIEDWPTQIGMSMGITLWLFNITMV